MQVETPSLVTPDDLRRPRRLHPLAIVMPFGSYSKPKQLGGRSTLIWSIVAVIVFGLFVAIMFARDIKPAFEGSSSGDPTITLSDGAPKVQESSNTESDKKTSFWPSFQYTIGPLQVLIVLLLLYKWWFFRWWIDDGAIWTQGGAFNRWTRRVSIDQIAALDRSTNLIQKAVRVSRISVETTANAAATSDVTLGCLSRKQADSLHAFLNQDLRELDTDPDRGDVQRLAVARPGWWELIAAGAFSLQVTRTVVILFVLYRLVNARTSGWLSSRANHLAENVSSSDHLVRNLTGTVIALLVLFWLTSILDFLASFTRFELSRRGSWILLRSGFFRKSVRLINVDAIYGYEAVSSPLQRRLGKSTLRMRIPAYGAPPNYKLVLHPSINPDTIVSLMQDLVGMDEDTARALSGQGMQPLVRASRVSFVRLWPIRIALLAIVAMGVIVLIAPAYWWSALPLLILTIPTAIWGFFAWKQAAWYGNSEGWLIVRRGVINRCAIVARVDRVQYIQWAQSVFVRRPNTAFALVVCIATSGSAGMINRVLARLNKLLAPSIVTLRNVTAGEAISIATTIGETRSLPPALLTARET